MSSKKLKILSEYLIIMAGTASLAVAINVFFEPLNLVTGGVSGIAIIVRSLAKEAGLDIPLWATNIALNLPLFVIGLKARGWRFLSRTVFSTVFLSVALYFTAFIPLVPDMDLTLAAVFGGVLSGVGLGLVFRCSATTGGSDLLASVIAKYKPHLPLSRLMFVIDALIIAAGFFVFGAFKAMYAIIAVYVTSMLISAVLEGLSFAKAAFIISDKHEEIGETLLTKLQRGATALNGSGLYTKTDKKVILCVVSSKEIVTLKKTVYEIDEKAFVIVADVREVLGEGFSAGK
ncbi:membrane protein [Clostridia bacterium]|nr:membrane protein [Clostridia bacterium]